MNNINSKAILFFKLFMDFDNQFSFKYYIKLFLFFLNITIIFYYLLQYFYQYSENLQAQIIDLFISFYDYKVLISIG